MTHPNPHSNKPAHVSPSIFLESSITNSIPIPAPSSNLRSSMANLFILLLALLPLISATTAPTAPTAAHSALESYNFPIGLLPTAVHSYTINTTSGHFSVRLSSNCRVTLPPDNYLASYSNIIRGRIVENKIEELDGIRVRALWKWWGITGIRRDGEDLVFEVGVVTAKYPAGNFGESPECEGGGKKDSK